MNTNRPKIRADLEEGHRCTSRFGGMRCDLRSGHSGAHKHDGAAGSHGWGGRRERKR